MRTRNFDERQFPVLFSPVSGTSTFVRKQLSISHHSEKKARGHQQVFCREATSQPEEEGQHSSSLEAIAFREATSQPEQEAKQSGPIEAIAFREATSQPEEEANQSSPIEAIAFREATSQPEEEAKQSSPIEAMAFREVSSSPGAEGDQRASKARGRATEKVAAAATKATLFEHNFETVRKGSIVENRERGRKIERVRDTIRSSDITSSNFVTVIHPNFVPSPSSPSTLPLPLSQASSKTHTRSSVVTRSLKGGNKGERKIENNREGKNEGRERERRNDNSGSTNNSNPKFQTLESIITKGKTTSHSIVSTGTGELSSSNITSNSAAPKALVQEREEEEEKKKKKREGASAGANFLPERTSCTLIKCIKNTSISLGADRNTCSTGNNSSDSSMGNHDAISGTNTTTKGQYSKPDKQSGSTSPNSTSNSNGTGGKMSKRLDREEGLLIRSSNISMMGPAYMEWLAGTGKEQQAHLHLLQETHVPQQDATDYMARCLKLGYNSFWTGAGTTGHGGIHGGTAALVDQRIKGHSHECKARH